MPHKIIIDGVIGVDAKAQDFRSSLSSAKNGPIEIDISSPGGHAFVGTTIYNMIKDHKGKTTAHVGALAASAASYVAMAADHVTVRENSSFMIHNALTIAAGNHKDMRKVADKLERVSDNLIRAYVTKTGKSREEIIKMMDDETWLYGSEIVDAGFADELIKADSEIENRDDAIFNAMAVVEECSESLKDEKQSREDLEKVAALLEPSEPNGAAHLTPAPKATLNKPEEENMTPEQIKALEDAAFAKGAESVKAEAVVELKEEPTVSTDPCALAESILESNGYTPKIKAMALKVVKGDQSAENLEAVVTAHDMFAEQVKALGAVAETEEIGSTPGEQQKESGLKDGKAVTQAGLDEAAATIKAQLNKGAK